MCGICGIYGKQADTIEKMVSALDHRGPDDRGVYKDENLSIGMTRLAIIDISQAGHQPMSNREKNVWIVFNGEIYNFLEHRLDLEQKGWRFNSRSDTEVILAMYETYGIDFIQRLRGMFAFAIYDKRDGRGKEKIILARDPLGIKPLLFHIQNNTLVFASEIRSLLASGKITPEINFNSLRQLLTYGSIYQPGTIFEKVEMLLPAHYLIYEHGKFSTHKYWSMATDRLPEMKTLPYPEIVKLTGAAIEDSVRAHMVSDVPIGAFLSGGVDSSLLVGFMTRIAGSRVKTYSVGFEEEGGSLDESLEAKRTAIFLGADHTHVMVGANDICEHIIKFIHAIDQPSVDGINSYFVSMAAHQGVTVAISGTGGDELFAGYPWFAEMVRYGDTHRADPWYRNIVNADPFNRFVFDKRFPTFNKIRANSGFLNRFGYINYLNTPLGSGRILTKEMRNRAHAGRSMGIDLHLCDELKEADSINRVTALCMCGYTNNQLLRDIDITSMAHSLEVRVPFLDVRLLDLALSLPSQAKLGKISIGIDPWTASYRETGSKKILVDIGRSLGILHESIDLQPKRGFTLPFTPWMKGPLKDILDETLSESVIHRRGWFDERMVVQLKNEFYAGNITWTTPWLLMTIELWAQSLNL